MAVNELPSTYQSRRHTELLVLYLNQIATCHSRSTSHHDFFPENCDAVNDEHWERFQQDLSAVESRYRGKWNTSVLADHCWNVTRDATQKQNKNRKRKHSTRFLVLSVCCVKTYEMKCLVFKLLTQLNVINISSEPEGNKNILVSYSFSPSSYFQCEKK